MIYITIDKRRATPTEIAALKNQPAYVSLVSEITRHGRQSGIELIIFEQPQKGFALQVAQNTESGALHTLLVGSTWPGKTSTINPVAKIGQFTDGVLQLLQSITRYHLDEQQHRLAKNTARAIAAKKTPNVRDLVERWRATPGLEAFAEAVGRSLETAPPQSIFALTD